MVLECASATDVVDGDRVPAGFDKAASYDLV